MGPHSPAVPYPQEFLTVSWAVTAALISHLDTLVWPFPNKKFPKNLPAANLLLPCMGIKGIKGSWGTHKDGETPLGPFKVTGLANSTFTLQIILPADQQSHSGGLGKLGQSSDPAAAGVGMFYLNRNSHRDSSMQGSPHTCPHGFHCQQNKKIPLSTCCHFQPSKHPTKSGLEDFPN